MNHVTVPPSGKTAETYKTKWVNDICGVCGGKGTNKVEIRDKPKTKDSSNTSGCVVLIPILLSLLGIFGLFLFANV